MADADKAVKDERQMRVELQKQIDQLKSSKMANESSDKKFKDEAFSKVRALEEQIEEEKERRKNDVEKLTNANNELTTKLTAKRKKLVTIKGSKTNLEEELKKERDKVNFQFILTSKNNLNTTKEIINATKDKPG